MATPLKDVGLRRTTCPPYRWDSAAGRVIMTLGSAWMSGASPSAQGRVAGSWGGMEG